MVLVTLSPPPGWLAKICYTFWKEAMSLPGATHLFFCMKHKKMQCSNKEHISLHIRASSRAGLLLYSYPVIYSQIILTRMTDV